MKKLLIAAIAIMSVLISACGSSPANGSPTDSVVNEPEANSEPSEVQPERQPRIGILTYVSDDAHAIAINAAVEEELAAAANLTIQSGADSQAEQHRNLDTLLEAGMEVLCISLMDTKASMGVVDKARISNTPVIFFNLEPEIAVLMDYENAIFVGTDSAAAGRAQGDLILDIWTSNPEYDRNGDGDFQFVMLTGAPEERASHGVTQALGHGVPLIQIGQTGAVMESTFSADIDNIELIIADNDEIALEAIAILNSLGYNLEGGDLFIPVIGADAAEEAIDAISRGMMSATVGRDTSAIGRTVAAIALNAASGTEFLQGVPYPRDSVAPIVRIPYTPYKG